jgi:hypothetical protein
MDRIRCEGLASPQTFNLKSGILGLRNYMKVYSSVREAEKVRCTVFWFISKTFVVILTSHG